ncbi:MAG: nickel pincer cofactor biosynthesis protein LarC [Clostridiales bacterium]|nr:nickel pincer cofactor biosynthesis protein LarC [Clostridiales bacterium]
MKILYIECAMGASGDMLLSALAGLLPDKNTFLQTINSLPIPGIRVDIGPCTRQGISGLHTKVSIGGIVEGEELHEHEHGHTHKHEHAHQHEHHDYANEHEQEHSHAHDQNSLDPILALIDSLPLSKKVVTDAQAVYRLIAEAESKAHGKPVAQVHFHELGMMDAVCDILGVCMLLEMLSPDRIIVSPIHLGSGTVHTAHGTLPVPAPATAELLKGFPVYSGDIVGELITPTGAALLRHFSTDTGSMPAMTVSQIGYGMGTKDFPRCNCLRVFWGTAAEAESLTDGVNDQIVELCCNIDDMTSEALGFAAEILRDNGALDVFFLPVMAKKNRAAYLLVCLCRPSDEHKMAVSLLKHTSTFGVRRSLQDRYILNREYRSTDTPFGPVTMKYGFGYGIEKQKPEYEDIAEIAKRTSLPISAVYDEILKALP